VKGFSYVLICCPFSEMYLQDKMFSGSRDEVDPILVAVRRYESPGGYRPQILRNHWKHFTR
jgi:hypothetical protein